MSKEIKLIVIGTIDQAEGESLNAYLAGLSQCYQKANIQPEQHYDIGDTYLGDAQPDFISVISFGNRKIFDSVYDSAEYKELIPLRDKAFANLQVYFAKT